MRTASNAWPCHCTTCYAIPPYMEDYIKRTSKDKALLDSIAATSRGSLRLRRLRAALLAAPHMTSLSAAPAPKRKRRVFDCQGSTDLLAALVRAEGQGKTGDKATDEAYDFSGKTFDFFSKIFGRASIDNANLPLTSSVHYEEIPGSGYDNAFWNGGQMVYGDGTLFERMTKSLDVVAHELTHGVTQYEAGLVYQNQSGALNEHFSDVFGVLVRQWARSETDPAKADWMLGRGLFRSPVPKTMGLRSMSAPGTAYDHPLIGKDPQPDHMSKYVRLPNTEQGDWGGVHYNSGIPNRAFCLAAVGLGKPAWEVAGKIWYVALTERLRDNADFKKCAYETISVAGDYFGAPARQTVRNAWIQVGVMTAGEGPVG
jgi:Zn-dependent metalloprotease